MVTLEMYFITQPDGRIKISFGSTSVDGTEIEMMWKDFYSQRLVDMTNQVNEALKKKEEEDGPGV